MVFGTLLFQAWIIAHGDACAKSQEVNSKWRNFHMNDDSVVVCSDGTQYVGVPHNDGCFVSVFYVGEEHRAFTFCLTMEQWGEFVERVRNNTLNPS